MDKIILVDAYAQIYRGFYALPLMSNSKGEFSNAVFAFSRFLLNLEKYHKSDYGAVVFDLGKCTARLEILPEYKANRSPMPDELRSQIPKIREVVHAFGYPLLESQGREADDLLGAIADKFTDFYVRIISADKDIAQVINDRVDMLVPAKRGGLDTRGVAEVIEKFDVKPDQIVDYLSLIGDASDNIIGVQGVGPKTASKLINKFGSIENMLQNIGTIQNDKLREKIANSATILEKNIKLIKLDLSFPDDSWLDNKIIIRTPPDWKLIADIAKEMELKSLLKDVEDFAPGSTESEKIDKSSNETKKDASSTIEQPSLFTPDMF